MEAGAMKEFWVDIIRREISYERNCILVEAESEEAAQERVRDHFLGKGDVLTCGEEMSEQHSKHLQIDESVVVEIGDAEEAA
jgi:hypothetical protein